MTTYGFSGLMKNLSSNASNLSLGLAISDLKNLITAVRVKSIVLDESHPRFIELGEWNTLGAIEYELVTSPILNSNSLPVAYPLNANFKSFPLINEIVYLISLPNTKIGESNVVTTPYYINTVGLWNHPHHNAYPLNSNNIPSIQNKDYNQTQAGSVKQVTDKSTETFLGKTFYERSNIHPILPFEGDIIQEGRWGNSIRFGSTVAGSPSPTIINNWSETGINGDPITILRNGQGNQTDQGWIPIVEDINNDESSMYLTSTQKVPLTAASIDYTSYSGSISPEKPNVFSGQQILLNSGRLVFNAGTDHILLSSAKTINLNSQKSVNIDTEDFTVQSRGKIYLGSYKADEPLLKGNLTVNLLKNLIKAIKQLNDTFRDLKTVPVVNKQIALLDVSVMLASLKVNTTLTDIENELKNLTSTSNFTI